MIGWLPSEPDALLVVLLGRDEVVSCVHCGRLLAYLREELGQRAFGRAINPNVSIRATIRLMYPRASERQGFPDHDQNVNDSFEHECRAFELQGAVDE